MATGQATDLLTIDEAAKLLTVSAVTLQRWVKQGRLPAYHVGPKAVRIRRGDLHRAMTPVAGREQPSIAATHAHGLPATVTPMTEERRQRAFDALAASKEHLARMRERRGGRPFDESWPLIREAREERSGRLS